MGPGRSVFDPLENPRQALRLAESMRVTEVSKEQESPEREGVGQGYPKLKKSGIGFWTRTRAVAAVVIVVVLLALFLSLVTGLL